MFFKISFLLLAIITTNIYAEENSFVYGESYYSFRATGNEIQVAKIKAKQKAEKRCISEVSRISDWSKDEMYNRYDDPYYRISAKFQCLENNLDWGGKSCFEPVRRCNTGTRNRDCPPCY